MTVELSCSVCGGPPGTYSKGMCNFHYNAARNPSKAANGMAQAKYRPAGVGPKRVAVLAEAYRTGKLGDYCSALLEAYLAGVVAPPRVVESGDTRTAAFLRPVTERNVA